MKRERKKWYCVWKWYEVMNVCQFFFFFVLCHFPTVKYQWKLWALLVAAVDTMIVCVPEKKNFSSASNNYLFAMNNGKVT